MIKCTGLTRRGAPCQRPAAKGINPPLCHHHRPRPEPGLVAPTAAVTLHGPHAAEPRDLSAELRLVRDVLDRLADRLDDPDYTLLPADMRTLAMLIFSGVRTVAYLLAQEDAETDEIQSWLDDTLDRLTQDMPDENSTNS